MSLVVLLRLIQVVLVSALCYNLTCRAEPANYGQHSSAPYTQVVESADPGLRWIAPPSLVYGTALGAAQLSATARTAGDFLYSPALGDVLPPGTQLLSVIFIPKNLNFKTAQATVNLVVTAPAGATFLLTANPASHYPADITVTPGADTVVQLDLTPVGPFHQTISLTCAAPVNLQCSLAPAVVSMGQAMVPIVLRISYVPLVQRSGTTQDSAPLSHPVPVAPVRMAIPFVLAMVCLFGFRSADEQVLIRRGSMALSILTLTAVCCFAIGCGSGKMYPLEKITVLASSPTVTQSLQLRASVLE